VTRSTEESLDNEHRPLPIAVPPKLSTVPFKNDSEPHVPPEPLPIPTDDPPPCTIRRPPISPASVRFEPDEHSSPASVEKAVEILLAFRAMSVTELLVNVAAEYEVNERERPFTMRRACAFSR
jgi:hypothetical protein